MANSTVRSIATFIHDLKAPPKPKPPPEPEYYYVYAVGFRCCKCNRITTFFDKDHNPVRRCGRDECRHRFCGSSRGDADETTDGEESPKEKKGFFEKLFAKKCKKVMLRQLRRE